MAKNDKSVTIRSKDFVAKDAPDFPGQQGWAVNADIRVGTNCWSGLHFVEDLSDAEMTDDEISAALLKQYGA